MKTQKRFFNQSWMKPEGTKTFLQMIIPTVVFLGLVKILFFYQEEETPEVAARHKNQKKQVTSIVLCAS